jgi:hypothetical protein
MADVPTIAAQVCPRYVALRFGLRYLNIMGIEEILHYFGYVWTGIMPGTHLLHATPHYAMQRRLTWVHIVE